METAYAKSRLCNERRPYIFISYAHRDSHRVLDIINHLVSEGYNVWWDEGIDPGTEWDENIASHVKGCSYFVAFVSNNYIASSNCKDELNYSRDLEKNQLLVYLEEVELPQGMAMRMNRIQSIFWCKYDDPAEAYAKLFSAKGIEVTKISNAAPEGWGPVNVPKEPAGRLIKSNTPLYIGGAVAAVAVIAVVLVIVLGGRDKTGYNARDTYALIDEVETEEVEQKEKIEETEETSYSDKTENEGLEDAEDESAATVSDEEDTGIEKVESIGKGGELTEDIPNTNSTAWDAELYEECYSFGSVYKRKEVSSVTFLSSIPERDEKGFDVSLDKDGSVLAWYDKNGGGMYDLVIASDGKIRLPESSSGLFAGYTNAISIEFNDVVDGSAVTDGSLLFAFCAKLKILDLTFVEHAMPKDLHCMLYNCSGLTEIKGLDMLDTSNATSIYSMFRGCSKLESIDVSNFDTSNVQNISVMFADCSMLKEIDVSNFDTSSCIYMGWMFSGCKSLKKLDVSNFDTSSVKDFRCMFQSVSGVEELDLRNFDFQSIDPESGAASMLLSVNPNMKILIKKDDLEMLQGLPEFPGSSFNATFVTE